jgi:hypothetical protein
MYTTMRWLTVEHDPRFFEILLRSSQLLAAYRSGAQGTVNRRRSLSFGLFASLRVRVPALAEQRRIVDLIEATDRTIEANETASRRASSSRSLLLSDQLSGYDGPTIRLGQVAVLGSGPSWAAEDESHDPGDGHVRVLGIRNVPVRQSPRG